MSLKYLIFLSLFSTPSFIFSQQLHKHFEADYINQSEKVKLFITTKAGTSYINAADTKKPVEIYGSNENDLASSSFKIENTNREHIIKAQLACKNHAGANFTEAITSNFFESEAGNNEFWQVNLSDRLPFKLDLEYLIGSSIIDLSDLSVERLKIKSGSADVKVKYSNKKQNVVAMDTFLIKVNLGSIDVQDLDLLLAKEIIAEVGFGSITLDCGNNWKINSRINASVGAGSMTIKLPPSDQAVLVRLNESPLCRVKMGQDFQRVGYNVFGNTAYRADPDNHIEFSLDVGMGSISFITE